MALREDLRFVGLALKRTPRAMLELLTAWEEHKAAVLLFLALLGVSVAGWAHQVPGWMPVVAFPVFLLLAVLSGARRVRDDQVTAARREEQRRAYHSDVVAAAKLLLRTAVEHAGALVSAATIVRAYEVVLTDGVEADTVEALIRKDYGLSAETAEQLVNALFEAHIVTSYDAPFTRYHSTRVRSLGDVGQPYTTQHYRREIKFNERGEKVLALLKDHWSRRANARAAAR
jgi:hypothetical protein